MGRLTLLFLATVTIVICLQLTGSDAESDKRLEERSEDQELQVREKRHLQGDQYYRYYGNNGKGKGKGKGKWRTGSQGKGKGKNWWSGRKWKFCSKNEDCENECCVRLREGSRGRCAQSTDQSSGRMCFASCQCQTGLECISRGPWRWFGKVQYGMCSEGAVTDGPIVTEPPGSGDEELWEKEIHSHIQWLDRL